MAGLCAYQLSGRRYPSTHSRGRTTCSLGGAALTVGMGHIEDRLDVCSDQLCDLRLAAPDRLKDAPNGRQVHRLTGDIYALIWLHEAKGIPDAFLLDQFAVGEMKKAVVSDLLRNGTDFR